ncbi:hypothetical protein [Corynebacterium heidelbergense]|uniref:Uncharacterized protein n=1 Tax=Corynebacterium heidelbergense TaxID=2055947 RepID=A0A364VEC8_9CORY|nr:hypothetical protein [Corynebacterium heidelbergense]RAV35000.1 hypothetical protein CWC39_00030 [Corynebacterium heidelbergense]WCZ37457.1 hypothetical protein CHEID_09655 [Corynebacterium heidelbergense]
MNQHSSPEPLDRIEQLELNVHRIRVCMLDAPEHHKAFDRECFLADLTFDQEADVRKAIIDFLRSGQISASELLTQVTKIAGNSSSAHRLIRAFRARGASPEKWSELDPDGLL